MCSEDIGDPMNIDPDSLDSDFYGDEQTISGLQSRVDSFDTDGWWRNQTSHGQPPPPGQLAVPGTSRLHNFYAGNPCAWQLGEPVDTFLGRLPPSSTYATPGREWTYICNPRVPEEQLPLGDGDEAPLGFHAQLRTFEEGGSQRLNLLRDFLDQAKAARTAGAVDGGEMDTARGLAVRDILALAHMLHIRCGKWMLFPNIGDVDRVWGAVARATANDELGVAAKVARRPGGAPSRSMLICVYTRDFLDKADLARVLQRIKELDLITQRGTQIYYKCDAYTYLGIGGGNIWGIKPSMYSSNEISAYNRR